MNKNLENFLEHCSGGDSPSVWVILYRGRFLKFPSGKSSWSKLGHAKNAFHNGVKEFIPYGFKGHFYDVNVHDVLDYCVENKIIEFINLTQDKMQSICEL